MPKVHKQVARKDYPRSNIKKGDLYYKWSLRPSGRGRGITYMSLTYPKPQQLTSSEFQRGIYDIDDMLAAFAPDPDSFEEDRDAICEAIRQLGQEQQEKFDNMPEGLQQGDTGQLLEERANNCEQWASDIEEIDMPERPDDEEPDPDADEDDEEADADEFEQEFESAVQSVKECGYPG